VQSSNTRSPMNMRAGGNVTEVKEKHCSKTLSPRDLIVDGSVIEVKAVQLLNASSPIAVMVGGIKILVREWRPVKAKSSNFVIAAASTTDTSLGISSNPSCAVHSHSFVTSLKSCPPPLYM